MNKQPDWKTDLDLLLKEHLGILAQSSEYPKLLEAVIRFVEEKKQLSGAEAKEYGIKLVLEAVRRIADEPIVQRDEDGLPVIPQRYRHYRDKDGHRTAHMIADDTGPWVSAAMVFRYLNKLDAEFKRRITERGS